MKKGKKDGEGGNREDLFFISMVLKRQTCRCFFFMLFEKKERKWRK